MPLPKAYERLQQAMTSPHSRMATFERDARDCFTDAISPHRGYSYPQLVELRMKHPEMYRAIMSKEDVAELLHDSAFD